MRASEKMIAHDQLCLMNEIKLLRSFFESCVFLWVVLRAKDCVLECKMVLTLSSLDIMTIELY